MCRIVPADYLSGLKARRRLGLALRSEKGRGWSAKPSQRINSGLPSSHAALEGVHDGPADHMAGQVGLRGLCAADER